MGFFPISPLLIIALLLIVIVSTSLDAVTDFSGSVFIVPIFSIILFSYNVPFTTIVGSSATGCFLNGLISTIINMRRCEIDWFLALIFEVLTATGIFLGAFLTTRIDERITTSIFAAFAITLAITLFLRIFHEKRHAREVFSIERNGATLIEENDGVKRQKHLLECPPFRGRGE
ncbi:MAG: sulfite exporter TauE/SafE family protein [Candidatus Heimdallarchaeota archaeon]